MKTRLVGEPAQVLPLSFNLPIPSSRTTSSLATWNPDATATLNARTPTNHSTQPQTPACANSCASSGPTWAAADACSWGCCCW